MVRRCVFIALLYLRIVVGWVRLYAVSLGEQSDASQSALSLGSEREVMGDE
jgi:hypothetical protein